MLDFAAYLRRIGLDPAGSPTWQTIHRSHATTIPFENLDSHRRGGYCFEHNLLLASALDHLGLEVETMLARVGGGDRPLGHLVLRITDREGCQWHADVGFGLGTLLDPSPWAPRESTSRPAGGSRSLPTVTNSSSRHSSRRGGRRCAGSCRSRRRGSTSRSATGGYASTRHRRSCFGLIASLNHPDGRREVMSDWSGPLQVMAISPEGVVETNEPREAIPSLGQKASSKTLPGCRWTPAFELHDLRGDLGDPVAHYQPRRQRGPHPVALPGSRQCDRVVGVKRIGM